MTQSRRDFLHSGIALWAASLIPSVSIAGGLPELKESDPIAIALGYKRTLTQSTLPNTQSEPVTLERSNFAAIALFTLLALTALADARRFPASRSQAQVGATPGFPLANN